MNESATGNFSPGMLIGHRYELLRPLRSEAHGVVMLARDQVLDLDIGLKLLSNEHPEFSRLLEYYRREALWGLRLHHPQILGVHHLDETTEGVFLIEEPFVGNSLWELLGHSEALTINDSLYFIEVLAQGVAYGHKQGVNHQNFNPQQVLVSATDGIKIINFAFPAEQTEIHTYPEIQAYIAPEVWQGRHPAAASNLFSLGVIGYRMLTGAFPFPLRAEGVLPYQIVLEPEAFDKIPEALQPLFNRCLKPEPENRFQSAADFLSRLAAIRERLTPVYAIKTKRIEEEAAVMTSPPAPVHKSEPKPTVGPLEPEVEIDSGWQESNSYQRQNFQDKFVNWIQDQSQRLAELLGPEPLRRNRNKQLTALLGGGLAFLLLIFGLNSLFSPTPKLKMPERSVQIDTNSAPAPQTTPTARPPIMAASPGNTQETKPEQTATQAPPDQPKPSPSVEGGAPLATPVSPKPKSPSSSAMVARPEKPAPKPEKSTAKPEKPPVPAQIPKAVKPEARPKLVATLDNETAARKKADALTKQGQRAIVKKGKKSDKTVYQVWVTAGATSPAKPAAPASKVKTEAKTNVAKPR